LSSSRALAISDSAQKNRSRSVARGRSRERSQNSSAVKSAASSCVISTGPSSRTSHSAPCRRTAITSHSNVPAISAA